MRVVGFQSTAFFAICYIYGILLVKSEPKYDEWAEKVKFHTGAAGTTRHRLLEEGGVAAAAHPDVGLSDIYVPLEMTCDPACTQRGNCNIETGLCECPFGYAGPTCTNGLLRACQTGPDSLPFFGFTIPRTCECHRQAREFYACTQERTCTLFSYYFRDTFCYEFTDVPAEQQYSRMPLPDAPGVVWRRGNVAGGMEGLQNMSAEERGMANNIWNSKMPSFPLERCGEHRCNERGACIQHKEQPNPECLCYKGFHGHDCSQTMPHLCPNECRGRGVCDRGFCHCQPPYFGLDCSRRHAWQLAPGATWVPNRSRLRIYMYDLPTHIAFPVAMDDDITEHVFNSYHTHRKFMDMLLQDDVVRTENPWEANLFYVPAQAYSYSSNTNPPANQIAHSLRYVVHNFPWFNMSQGRDHFVWTTGDRGACYLGAELRNVIIVTQFGLHASTRDNATTFLRPLPEHPDHGCYHPVKDVLSPPWYDHHQGVDGAPKVYEEVVRNNGEDPKRDILVFFAGTVRPKDKVYSGGVRQALARHLKHLLSSGSGNFSDVLFIEGFTHQYGDLHTRSKFCLAPHGAGFGIRLTIAMAHACIPVIIQDTVWQPFESDGSLPYHEFSLRLGKADIPHIIPVLRSVSERRLREMRLAMARHYGAFVWDPALGGTAYNHTITALQRRLAGVWGQLWSSRR